MKKLLLLLTLLAVTRSSVAQRDPNILRVETRLIEVYATVMDNHGHYKDDLSANHFHVLDNGEPQTIKYFETTYQPLHCAILLDTTASMAKVLPTLKNALLQFVDQLGEGDDIALYNFDEKVQTQQDFTKDKAAIKRAAMRLHAQGRTALFDAVSEVSRDMNDLAGKKAIIVFTDGDDNTSALTAQSAVERARKSGIPLFTIAEGEAVSSPQLRRLLVDMSTSTGGSSFEVKEPKDMQGVFARISEQMQHIYLLAYQPKIKPLDGKWRKIEVSIEGSNEYRIRAKQGYFPR